MPLSYRIEYSPDAEDHLRALARRQQVLLLNTVDRQLIHQPTFATRNRKPMRPNPLAPWELRIGHLRVYSDVQETPRRVVSVRAIGIKRRNHVVIGKEILEL
jgi:mRNA-degrading endonuclease RelE of RelBE toxin-antitoxin system